jgi:hypothetical protein
MPNVHHGHAPGHIRETFLSAEEAFIGWRPGEPEPMVKCEDDYMAREIPISQACRLVWHCRDQLPALEREQLSYVLPDMRGATYAAAARSMLAAIKVRRQAV